jgi:uncharacterized protein (DUF305 family)
MRGISTPASAIALMALALTVACGGAARSGPAPGPDAGASARPSQDIDYEALYRARQDSARMRFTDADVYFVTGMIGHHAQALVMSGMAPTHGASPTVQTLAARIINAQKDEIATMERWLRDRGQTVPVVHIAGTELTVEGADHAMHMPGMLTPEQIRELDEARGTGFDRLFLRYMIQHHQGAVTMVTDLFEVDGALQDEQVFKLASDIQVDQLTEIARMERMLAGLPADGGAR